MAWGKISCVIFLTCICIVECSLERVVEADAGQIRGVLDPRGYFKYLGIPYGQVNPANPFGEATSYPEFNGIYDALSDSVICPQIRNGQTAGDVNCLTLHVYTPLSVLPNSQLPVIVWIHGGFFMYGHALESMFGPNYIVRRDVIFVAINYRTGPYGFMCLGIDAAAGNQGLKDQQLAFEWVQKNIEAFGGNPNDITLAGLSAGAHSIDFHLHSLRNAPYSKVIMQSGSSLASTVFYKPDREAAVKIADYLGLSATNSRSAISMLAQANAHDVVRAVDELKIDFKPCVESEFESVEPFLTSNWINAVPTKVKDITVLIGFNEFERMNFHINKGPEHFQDLDIFTDYLNQTFDFTSSEDDERFVRMRNFLQRFYLGDEEISQEVVWPVINFDSDFIYIYPIQRSIKKFLNGDAKDIFYYMFAYSGGRNFGKIETGVTLEGAAHADELGYLFDISILPEQISAEDQLVLDRMTTMWTNFAKYGDPTPFTSDLVPIRWTALTNQTYNYMRIDSTLSMETRPFNRRMAFFDLFYKYNDRFQRTFDESYVEEEDNGATINTVSLITLLSAVILFMGLHL